MMSSNGNNHQQNPSHKPPSRDSRNVRVDEFGIIRGDDRSRSSDSVPVEDPSLNLTDDEMSSRVLEGIETSDNEAPPTFGSKDGIIGITASESEAILDASTSAADYLASDLHIDMDDLTGASDDISQKIHSKTFSARQDETESLTEFEEIERLIQANTVQDSDGELSDLPIDLEQRILSGRVSRESNKSGLSARRQDSSSEHERSKVTDDTSHSSSVPISDRFSATGQTHPKLHSALHQDTGYSSEPNATEVVTEPAHSHSPQPHAVDLSIENQQEASFGNESSDVAGHSLLPDEQYDEHEAMEDDVNDMSYHHDGNVTADDFMIPTNRSAVGDTNQPSSLVATFGTTEDFEKLLKQQLDNDGETSDHDQPQPLESPLASEGESPQFTSTARRRLPRTTPRKSVSPSPRSARSKLKLSSRSDTPRESARTSKTRSANPRLSRGQRGTRSPAASRVRRANNAAHGRSKKARPLEIEDASSDSTLCSIVVKRPDLMSLHRESSEDLSVRSDLSKTELRHKLKEEARTRRRDEEFVKELKSNYDDLLMKYAQAENTIDHLRLGAKINLYASVPRPSGEAPELPFEEAEISHQGKHPQQAQTTGMRESHQPHSSRLPSVGSDTLVESSLQLPAAASKEFLKVALQLQAKDVQDKVDSFATLLTEAHLSPIEQDQVMENIEEAMRDLERDYLAAIDEHAAEQRRFCIATGGSMEQTQPFDPDRAMESDILRLGQKVKNLRNHILAQTEVPSRHSPAPLTQRSRGEGERSNESSPEADVDERFNQLLHQYNRVPPQDDGHTTAPSLVFSSREDEEERGSPQHEIPNRFFEPASTQHDSSVTTQQEDSPRPEPPVQSRRQRHASTGSSVNQSGASPSPTRKRNSRLPRPVGSSPNRKGSPSPSTKNRRPDKGTDSGFVGSESSRQSGGLVQPAKVKLVTRPPAAVGVKKPAQATAAPWPAERKGRPLSRGSSTQRSEDDSFVTSHNEHSNLPSSYIDRVGIFKPPTSYTMDDSVDDVSTTSTVREMLRPQPRAYSPSRSPSTKPHTAPFPRGSRTEGSVKSKASTKRSVASSTRDSTLDMIRGEISKLRDEIKSAKLNGGTVQPIHTSTPRRHLAGASTPKPESDEETLRALRSDVKALKDEVQKQSRGKRGTDASDTYSVRSAGEPSRQSRSDKEGSTRGRRSRRSRSLGRDELSDVDGRDSTTRGRRRSRSQDRQGPWSGGFWTYVPPSAPIWGSVSAPLGRTYTRVASPVRTVAPQPAPAVYTSPPVVHTAPIIGHPSNVVYVEPQTPSPARVYVQSTPRTPRIYTTPSKPTASVFISPKQSSRGGLRKATLYVMDSDDDEPLRRSHLSSRLRRSSSMSKLRHEPTLVALPDNRLNESIDRAERSADRLRQQSRSMYHSVRDNVYRAQLLADTM